MNKQENLFRGLLLDFDEEKSSVNGGEWVFGNLIQQFDYPTVDDKNSGSTFDTDDEGFVRNAVLQHTFIQWDGMPSWGGDDIFEVDPKTVGQKTGRIDKDHDSIYAGDLVFHSRKKIHCLIYWDDKMSAFMICGEKFKDFLGAVNTERDLKVSGTFFDDAKMEEDCEAILKIVR